MHQKFRDFPSHRSLSWLAVLLILPFKQWNHWPKHNIRPRMWQTVTNINIRSFFTAKVRGGAFSRSCSLLTLNCFHQLASLQYVRNALILIDGERKRDLNVKWDLNVNNASRSRMVNYIDRNPYHKSNNKITSKFLEISQGKISDSPLVRKLYRWYINRWWERPATVRQGIGSTSVQRTRNVFILLTDKNIILVLLYTEINIALLHPTMSRQLHCQKRRRWGERSSSTGWNCLDVIRTL